jgi:hypothetical protein
MTSIITAPDLYGPAIYVFLLSIMLVLAMKVSHTTVGDGSLMGTSLFSCLFYWFGASAVLYLTSKFFGSDISLVATLSAVGYEYAPLNVIAAWSLFYSEFHWTANLVFYLLFFALTGLSAASLARYVFFTLLNFQDNGIKGTKQAKWFRSYVYGSWYASSFCAVHSLCLYFSIQSNQFITCSRLERRFNK